MSRHLHPFDTKSLWCKAVRVKITICGSMSFAHEMQDVATKLQEQGHQVYLPEGTLAYASLGADLAAIAEDAALKRKKDLIRRHHALIRDSDAILVVNQDRGGIKNYLGANSFLEIGFAHVLHKKIFLLNAVPEIAFCRPEIEAMQPTVIYGDLSRVR